MINKKTEYILFSLINLASRDNSEFISSKIIARNEKIPLNYMPQLMAILTKKGWVESVRGVNGGVRLIVNPEKITVLDVINLSEDSFFIKKCFGEGCDFNHRKYCSLFPLWSEAQSKVEDVMRNSTIADLANKRVKRKA